MATNTREIFRVDLNSLFFRTLLPLTAMVFIAVLAGAVVSLRATQGLYNDMMEENLRNRLIHARNIVSDIKTDIPLGQNMLEEKVAPALGLVFTGNNTDVMLMSTHGDILYNSSTKSLPFDAGLVQQINLTQDSALHTYKANGYIFVRVYSSAQNAHIVTYNNETFRDSPFYERASDTMWLLLPVITLVMIPLMYGLLQVTVLGPIRGLSRSMQEIIKSDDFKQTVSLSGSQELQNLTRQFNTLLHHLKQRDDILKEHNENLEELVEARSQKILDMQDHLVQQERLAAIGEFSSSIAHELRNPLSSIKMGIEQLAPQAQQLDEKNVRRLELVQGQIKRLDGMLKGILTFAATTPTEVSAQTLSHILEEGKPTFDALAHENGTEIKYMGLSSRVHILTDKNKLLQALINLVKNAVEAHSGEAPVRMTVSYDEKSAYIQIQNGGKPIAPDVLDRLFEPFFTTKTGGTGLGLPTTKRLIEEMGGAIDIESSEELGTTATLTLSLAEKTT